jgi:hypothetical protein
MKRIDVILRALFARPRAREQCGVMAYGAAPLRRLAEGRRAFAGPRQDQPQSAAAHALARMRIRAARRM